MGPKVTPSIAPSLARAWLRSPISRSRLPHQRAQNPSTRQNAIESLNRGHSEKPPKRAVTFSPLMKCCDKAIYSGPSASLRRQGRRQDGLLPANQFAILYPERFNNEPPKLAWAKPHTQSFGYSPIADLFRRYRFNGIARRWARRADFWGSFSNTSHRHGS